MKTDKEFKSALIELGERIYHLRILKKYTPKEIAPMLHLSTVAYRNIEKGKCDLSYTKLLHLSEILQIDIMDLVKNPGSRTAASEIKIIKLGSHEMPGGKNIHNHIQHKIML